VLYQIHYGVPLEEDASPEAEEVDILGENATLDHGPDGLQGPRCQTRELLD